MSQGMRDILSNRKFAIPLIILLAFCFIGLLMIGVVLIFRPGADEPVAEVTDPVVEITDTVAPTDTPEPTEDLATATSRPTNTPVLRSTTVSSGVDTDATATAAAEVTSVAGTEVASVETAVAEATQATVEATSTVEPGDELADTGVGWGLVLFSGVGLAGLAIVARRLRMVA